MDHRTAFLSHVTPVAGTCQRPKGIFKRIAVLMAVRRSRNELSHLTDTQLLDIGLTRDAAEAELQRPIWDVPANWRHR